MSTVRRAALVLIGLLGTAFVLAAPAAAHATVVSSSPADGSRLSAVPRTVTITFDENVGLGGIGYLHVTDQTGARVDAGPASHPANDDAKVLDTLRAGLGDGTYTASFRVISADSHPVAGTIRFVVGNGAIVRGSIAANAAQGGVTDAFAVVRWVSYGGLALLGGAWLLLTVWPAGRADRRAVRVIWAGWGLATAGAALETLLQGPDSAGSGISQLFTYRLVDATLHSDYGLEHSARMVLLGALALVLTRVLQPRAADRTLRVLAGVLGVGVLATFSVSGHASTTSPAWLSVPLDLLHLAAMAAWLGGLVLLIAAVLPRREPAELAAVLPVFSKVAFASVVTLAVTGTYAAWRGVGTVDAWRTSYGLLVLAKVVLFVGLVALGNVSRRSVQRRALDAADRSPGRVMAFAGPNRPSYEQPARGDTGARATADNQTADNQTDANQPAGNQPADLETERLRRSVTVEVVLGVTVLLLTGFLVALPRGKEALAASYRAPVSATADLGGGRRVTVVADPGTHGPLELAIAVDGGPRASVTAEATQQQQQIGPLPVHVTRRGARTFDGSVTLPVAGAWRIDLVVSTSDVDAVTTDLTLTLH